MERLTPHQLAIVDLRTRRGMSVSEAAYELGCSPHTLRNTSTTIIDRLGVRCFAQVGWIYGREYPEGLDRPKAMRARDV